MPSIKALSIRQPWVWAIFHAGKRIENRSWKTNYRGPLLLCASSVKQGTVPAIDWIRENVTHKCPDTKDHVYGAAVGIVDMTECYRYQDLPDELQNVYADGPYCHIYEDPTPFKTPVPIKGQLGLFDVELSEIADALREIKIDPLSLLDDSPDRLIVEFPLPSKYLHPNWRPGSRKGGIIRSKHRKETRSAATVATMSAMSRREDYKFPWREATLQATYHLPRKRDDDGLISWMKSIRDGIQDAGVIKNDSGFKVVPVQQVTDGKNPKLVVTIEKVA